MKEVIYNGSKPETIEIIIAEVERQLTLKSEVTFIGPPHIVLNGQDLLAAIEESTNAERKACAKLARIACLITPDGRTPTRDEVQLCENTVKLILARKGVLGKED